MKWFALALLLLCSSRPCHATELPLQEPLDFVPHDADFVVWTDDVGPVRELLRGQIETWLDTVPDELESLSENFSDQSQLSQWLDPIIKETESWIEPLSEIAERLDSSVFDGPAVVWSRKQDDRRVVVLVAATRASEDDIEALFESVTSPALVQWQRAWQAPAPEPQSDEHSPQLWRLADGWLVASNDEETRDALIAAIDRGAVHSRFDADREFLLVRSQLPRGARGSIRFHISGEPLRQLLQRSLMSQQLPYLVLDPAQPFSRWESLGLHELKSLGGQVTLNDERLEEHAHAAVIDAFLLCTQPRVGLWSLIEPEGEFELERFPAQQQPLSSFLQFQIDGERVGALLDAIEGDDSTGEVSQQMQGLQAYIDTWIETMDRTYRWPEEMARDVDSIAYYGTRSSQLGWQGWWTDSAAIRIRSSSASQEADEVVRQMLSADSTAEPVDIASDRRGDLQVWRPTDTAINRYLSEVFEPKLRQQQADAWRNLNAANPAVQQQLTEDQLKQMRDGWEKYIVQALSIERDRRDRSYQFNGQWLSLTSASESQLWENQSANEQLEQLALTTRELQKSLELDSPLVLVGGVWPSVDHHVMYGASIATLLQADRETTEQIDTLRAAVMAFRMAAHGFWDQTLMSRSPEIVLLGGYRDRGLEVRVVLGLRDSQE